MFSKVSKRFYRYPRRVELFFFFFFFLGGGGGGVMMLISLETYRTYNFPGGGGWCRLYTTSGSAHALIFRVDSYFLIAPINYVETHCT